MAGAKIVFDSERDMEEFLHESWFELEEDWIEWPDLPDGCEFEYRDSPDTTLRRQVRIVGASESGEVDAPIDLMHERWFRTPDMPEGQYLARAVMLIELKNEPLTHKHLDQLLRYFEAFKASCERGDEAAGLVCCALVGTGLVGGMDRILRAIDFVGAYSWLVEDREVGLGIWSRPGGWAAPKTKQLAEVIPIDPAEPKGGF